MSTQAKTTDDIKASIMEDIEAKTTEDINGKTTRGTMRSLSCYLCQKSVPSANAMSIHKRDQHDGEQGRIFRSSASGQDTSSDEQLLDEFDKELNRVTRHPATSRFTEQMFEKAELRLENGEREFAFIISHGSKRLISGSKAHERIVKRRALEVVKDIR
ncbi:hypothetical protein BGX26_010658 [Mortierella sp. AD094]|nr:hypothetical protein BGX26_010658 [Mortierella sp. AD094]